VTGVQTCALPIYRDLVVIGRLAAGQREGAGLGHDRWDQQGCQVLGDVGRIERAAADRRGEHPRQAVFVIEVEAGAREGTELDEPPPVNHDLGSLAQQAERSMPASAER